MKFLLLGVCLFLFSGAAFAQSANGTITGTISDPAGAVIANAAVQARNVQTGATYQAESTTAGNYTIAQLPITVFRPPVIVGDRLLVDGAVFDVPVSVMAAEQQGPIIACDVTERKLRAHSAGEPPRPPTLMVWMLGPSTNPEGGFGWTTAHPATTSTMPSSIAIR